VRLRSAGRTLRTAPADFAGQWHPAIVPSPQPLASGHDRRQAITLLEVLMSMFVLTVGLLSVASLLPVGSFQAARALVDDRKAVLGQNAAREAKTRGVLRPDFWWYSNGMPYVTNAWWANPNNFTPPSAIGTLTDSFSKPIDARGSVKPPSESLPPVCIDPWMLNKARQYKYNQSMNGAGSIGYFAVGAGSDVTPRPDLSPLAMPRLTLLQSNAGFAALGNASLTGFLANDQGVVSGDDLAFALDQSNPDSPPALGFNGNGRPTTMGGNGTKRNFNGQFTWLATLVPVYGDGVTIVNRNLMQLSVVVFNQRVATSLPPNDLSKNAGATERAALAVFQGVPGKQYYMPKGGAGVGNDTMELVLTIPPGRTNPQASDLNVNIGEWIMLGTLITDYNAPGSVRPMFRWYRVVGASRTLPTSDPSTPPIVKTNYSSQYFRYITVAGPLWNLATVTTFPLNTTAANYNGNGTPISGRGQSGNVYQFVAYIYDGAVAVYERTVRLEGPSMWSN
jgi:hypothetical protein